MMDVMEDLYQEEIYRIPAPPMAVVVPRWNDLSPEDISLLSKILSAIKVSLAAVKVIETPLIKLQELSVGQAAAIFLIFGSKTEPSVELYKKEKVAGFQIIAADPLNQLDDVKKKNLWQTLRQL
jgi:hypothetical protein